ncbi:hypothetical protein KIW84_056694 [Lathyrus oleraceus]|uniref:Retrovirus-related Pol polyprotein from transposon TNT 1-94-like beta-barrel domain-containing protein n=1 Tax=Pisum sativum TaxID=3888 RepID=A0A9D5ALR7_PEA|nr:hypothetical protein KIW84_056694 [Pisum sativum]
MNGKKEAFINIDSSFGSKVKLGNGEHVEVKGEGIIGVTKKQGSKGIHDTLYVPELDENLLSIGQLLEHGYSLNFENRNDITEISNVKALIYSKFCIKGLVPLQYLLGLEVARSSSDIIFTQ